MKSIPIYNNTTVGAMIANEEWGAIVQMLLEERQEERQEEEEESQQQQQQHQQQEKTLTKRTTHCQILFEDILPTVRSSDLPWELLKKRDDEEAKTLFLLLIKLGEKKFVMNANFFFQGDDLTYSGTLLHVACASSVVYMDVISKLLEVGGNELVMTKDDEGRNSLHVLCEYNPTSLDVASMLIEVGGKALVMEEECYGHTPLHYLCKGAEERVKNNVDGTLIEEAWLNILTQHGGAELLTQTNELDMTPLQVLIANDNTYGWMNQEETETYWNRLSGSAVLLINKGIEQQVGGGYGIGGLFTPTIEKIQDRIFQNWDNIVIPALEQIMVVLHHDQHLPILQALIINEVPRRIIKSTVNRFTASINTADSFGKYPIDIAVQHGLAWNNGMKEVVEGTNADLLTREDVSTGLFPFMIAAVGDENSYDFETVFHLIKVSPKLVKLFCC